LSAGCGMAVANETWLICGGRAFADADGLARIMAAVIAAKGGRPARLVHGAAPGADALAAACVVRNQRMLDAAKPTLVIAFPGGAGTRDMIRRAKSAGVEVLEVSRRHLLQAAVLADDIGPD
jgi:hypothetical protein